MNSQAVNDNQVITKLPVDQFHQENEQSGRDRRLDFYKKSSASVRNNQGNKFKDNNLFNLDSITVNRDCT